MADLFDPLTFAHGPAMKNRFMLAPLTNWQSHPDGRLSDDEFKWLTLRAEGGFGLTMTCAAHVQAVGQGFPGQLGVFGDQHLEGLSRLAAAIKAHGSVSSLQMHHAGHRSPKELVGQPVCPSDDPETGARGLSLGERRLDDGEFLDVISATPAELLAWCRDGRITDAKTLTGALWLQNVLSAAWKLDWQAQSGQP